MGLNEADVRRIAWTFVQAFLGVFLAGIGGVLTSPDFSTGKAAGVALVGAALAAGFSALKNFVTPDGSTLK